MLYDEFEKIDTKEFVRKNWSRGLFMRFDQRSSSKQTSVQTTGLSDYQLQGAQDIWNTYLPQLGTGTLGYPSDLEESALNMLKSANIWEPMVQAGTNLITGASGPQELTPEEQQRMWTQRKNELTNIEKNIAEPSRKEAFAGPGYWSSARKEGQITGYGEGGRSSFADYLGNEYTAFRNWADQYNRTIQQNKAGLALSAIGAVPSALSGWANTLFGTGAQARELLNQITDPQVLQVLQSLLGLQTQNIVTTSKGTTTPSDFQKAANWAGVLSLGMQGLGGFGGTGSAGLGGGTQPYTLSPQLYDIAYALT